MLFVYELRSDSPMLIIDSVTLCRVSCGSLAERAEEFLDSWIDPQVGRKATVVNPTTLEVCATFAVVDTDPPKWRTYEN